MKTLLSYSCFLLIAFVVACTTMVQNGTKIYIEQTLESLEPRPGVKLKYLLLKPNKPKAAVILFAGGHGNLELSGSRKFHTIGWGRNNFLVRTRKQFAAQGFLVVVFDFPSDKRTNYVDAATLYRLSDTHVSDVLAVVRKLKKDHNLPVWLVGTSSGTWSVAYAASKRRADFDGIVLTASLTDYTNHPNTAHPQGILDLPLNMVREPALVISHEKDGCRYSPPSGAEYVKKALAGAPRVEVAMISGGWLAESSSCQALAPHGFYGKEKETVQIIADFIRTN